MISSQRLLLRFGVVGYAPDVDVHLVDGTFELFRCFHGAPRASGADGREVGAARGFLATMVALLNDATHVAVAFDSVLAPPGRPGREAESLIAHQAPLAAEAVRALGLTVWPTGRYQADEMLATAADRLAADGSVDRVVICSTDNDFHQCVRSDRVVVLDRIRDVVTDERAVRARYGVSPAQLPDLFALVGDHSDGLPGVPGWGVKSSAKLLARYGTLDAVPADPEAWDIDLRGRDRLASALIDRWAEALLSRDLARLRTDLPLSIDAGDLEWRGPRRDRLAALADVLGDRSAIDRLNH
jgi:5'-3' exonuclease